MRKNMSNTACVPGTIVIILLAWISTGCGTGAPPQPTDADVDREMEQLFMGGGQPEPMPAPPPMAPQYPQMNQGSSNNIQMLQQMLNARRMG